MSSDVKTLQQKQAIIFGCEGLTLSDDERAFFKEAQPFGFILFARNIETPDQLRTLVHNIRETVGWDCPILIDQEGGKVQRLRQPHWLEHSPFQDLGDLFRARFDKGLTAARLHSLSIAHMLYDLGITVNCTPVLDVPAADAHDVIGNRAFSSDPNVVALLGRKVVEAYLEGGITPVIKHIPGHGRARADSHEDLPRVETSAKAMQDSDFLPFYEVCQQENAKGAWGMTAHVIYEAIDSDYPATLSKDVIDNTIRKEIGFDGFLTGDDVFMKALDPYGDLAARVEKSLRAGIDAALFCHGDLQQMEQGLKGSAPLTAKAAERAKQAEEYRLRGQAFFDDNAIENIREELYALLPASARKTLKTGS